MKLSVITATYNSEKTLQACLNSVAQQTAVANIEHIIVDGRSTDTTLAIIASYPHISQVVSAKDRGIYHAFNRGIGLATGDIVYFLNSDDALFDTNVIADVLAAMSSQLDYYCGTIFCFDSMTGESYFSASRQNDPVNFKPRHQAFFCRRQLFTQLGPFNECLTIAADTYFMKKAIQKNNGIFTERPIARFSLLGISSEASSRAKVLAQDAIVDTLLELNTVHSQLPEKLATQTQNLLQIKQLMLNIMQQRIDLTLLREKRIVVFGARELSQLFYHFFCQHQLQVVGFVVSSADNLPVYQQISVISIQDLKSAKPDIVINCIEGRHEVEVAARLLEVCPGLTVLSWRDFCTHQPLLSVSKAR